METKLPLWIGIVVWAILIFAFAWVMMRLDEMRRKNRFDRYNNSFKEMASKPDPRWHHLECHQCGRMYIKFNSDAEINMIFCCKACEYGY